MELAAAKGVELLGSPTVVGSPQFAFMAQTIRDGKLGRVAAAHASYGHTGPSWSSFFYEKDGGSLYDLGVYSITTLTGLLGPDDGVKPWLGVGPQVVADGTGITISGWVSRDWIAEGAIMAAASRRRRRLAHHHRQRRRVDAL